MSEEFRAIIFGLAVLLIACGLLFGLKRTFGTIEGTTFIALLLVPLIVYAFVSGRLQEFSGPGGWGAKFRSVAVATVETTGIIEDAEPLQTVEKRGARDLSQLVANLDPNRPNALRLRVGRQGYYVADVIKTYLEMLMSVGPSTYVVFVDNATEKFIGSSSASQVLALLTQPSLRDSFMEELQRGGQNAFEGFDFLVRESLTAEDTNATALQKFLDTNAEALVVVSQASGEPTGVADRNRLVTKLMLKLAKGGE